MAALTLKNLLGPRASSAPAVRALVEAMGPGLAIEDTSGKLLLGDVSTGPSREPIHAQDSAIGWVTGPPSFARALASMLTHLAGKESEGRALGAEVLHLYRMVHLIEQLSEQLAALLDVGAVGKSALEQAQRLIRATQGGILVMENAGGLLTSAAIFGAEVPPLPPASRFVASIMENGIAEVVNDCAADPRGIDCEPSVHSLICAPLRGKQRTVGVITLAKATGDPYSSADLQLLKTIALQTAAAIENALLCTEMVDAVRDREQLAAIQKELDTARTIQHSLVPRVFPPFPDRTDFDIHAQMTSAKAVGGDFFDFFLIDEDRLGVVIGDVSGKGTPAALFMAVTRTQIKTTALQGLQPEQCLLDVNSVLVREKVSSMFATCFYGILNTRSGELKYCNAGHNPPYVLRSTGVVEPVPDGGGLPLGMFDGLGYTGSCLQLGPGDTLFLYTDGVPEAMNAANDDFTDERLARVLSDAAPMACRGLVDHVTGELLAFTAGAPQSDDITMLAVRMRPV